MAAAVGLSATMIAVAPQAAAEAAACPTVRADVQTGADMMASQVSTVPVLTTVASLGALPHPVATLPATRVAPVETTVYAVGARLIGHRLDPDGDIHLLLRDGAGGQAAADVPDPACVPSSSPFRTAIAEVRAQLLAAFTVGPTLTAADVPVRIDGVGYHDVAGSTGAAPNGVSLHPVLSLQLGAPAGSTRRISGADRFATAAAVSAATFPTGAPVVFVASGRDFPDAVSGAAAAGAHRAPVLLAEPGALPAATAAELDRLGAGTGYLLGGEGALSAGVESAVRARVGRVVRLAGVDRYATSAAVSRALFTPGVADALVATGLDFPDALAGSAAAGALGGPVLLVSPGSVPGPVVAELTRLRPARITLLGGTAAVSAAVQSKLAAVAPVRRLAGVDRYATAATVATTVFPKADQVLLATGSGFADALAGGPAGALAKAPVLLSGAACVPSTTGRALGRLGLPGLTLLGGLGALASTVARLAPCTVYVAPPYVERVPVPAGCLTVSPAIVGIKVYLVQQALGLVGHRERYDSATVSAVRAFQQRRGLRVTGVVDRTTWDALGTGYDFCVDRFTVQPTVVPDALPSAHIAALLAFAQAQVGRPYVWGGAGPMGYDCSGLALQAMYAGGRTLPGVTTDRHVEADFRTAAVWYRSPAFVHVPLAQRRAGDLVFWYDTISHMAVYLGADRIVEAVRPQVRTTSLWAHGTPLPTVVRPFVGYG